jgi:molybdate transport system permease protein
MKSMRAKLRRSKFEALTVFLTLLLTAFILTVLVCIISHTTPGDFLDSITSQEIQFAIKLSLLTSTISTALSVIVGIPIAYSLARYNIPLKSLINTVVDLPLALPPLVAGVGLLLFFTTTPGEALEEMGLQFVFSPPGIVLAQFLVNIPFTIRVLRSTFEGIDPRYEYVAQTLGLNPMRAFLRVSLPMSRRGILAGSVITWSGAMGEFGAVLMLAGATRLKTETLPISIYLNMSCGDLDMAVAASSILIFISFISLFLFEKYSGGHAY